MYYCKDIELLKGTNEEYHPTTDLDIFCDLLGDQAKVILPEELLRYIFRQGKASKRVNLFVNALYELVVSDDREGFNYSDEEDMIIDSIIEKIGVFGGWKGDDSDG